MKFHLIILAVSVIACESLLEFKFKFYGTQYLDYKIVTDGGDIEKLVGTPYFNPSAPTMIFTHGYTFYLQARGARNFIEAHLQLPNRGNIIYIDWTKYTNRKAELNAKVFEQVVNGSYAMLSRLRAAGGDFSQAHLIGFGLGSQMFGYISRLFQANENFKFPRLTCLDPTGENFEKVYGFWIENLVPVDRGCANFVDVIHTNAGTIGDETVCGHVDFYVNGGCKQPLCMNMWRLAEFAIFDVQMFIGCDHQLAWQYYLESMKRNSSSPAFLAKKCTHCYEKGEAKKFDEDCTQKTDVSMGYFATTANDESKFGCYQVITNEMSPFSQD